MAQWLRVHTTLQRTWFPACTSRSSQLLETPISRNLIPSSGLHGFLHARARGIHKLMKTHTKNN